MGKTHDCFMNIKRHNNFVRILKMARQLFFREVSYFSNGTRCKDNWTELWSTGFRYGEEQLGAKFASVGHLLFL